MATTTFYKDKCAMNALKSKLLKKDTSSKKELNSSYESVDDIDEVDDGAQSILMGIISQLRPGCDLSRITLPTFILERKSMLERVSNQLQQPDILLKAKQSKDLDRFLLVVKWYMSCWHICPKAVKKPLNPILGEYFTCYWDLNDNGDDKAYYVAEQTSHHPPKSSYFYVIPSKNIRVDGIVVPKSRFLGNSTAAMMEGITKLTFLDDDNNEDVYTLTQPNMYARGILFGSLKFELGDHLIIESKDGEYKADIEFKTKGFISGTYNSIQGHIFNKANEKLFEITGKWDEVMYIKKLSSRDDKQEVFFDCSKAKPLKPKVRPLEEQGQFESRKLWKKVTDALAKRDHEVATDEKFKIEEQQRNDAKERLNDGVEFHPKLFKPLTIQEESSFGNEHLEYVIYKDHQLNNSLKQHSIEQAIEDLYQIAPFLPGQNFDSKFEIPAFQKS